MDSERERYQRDWAEYLEEQAEADAEEFEAIERARDEREAELDEAAMQRSTGASR